MHGASELEHLERIPASIREGPVGDAVLIHWDTNFPEENLVGAIDTSADEANGGSELAVWNVGIIRGAGWGEEKIKMLETVYGRLYLETQKTEVPVMLGGHFNAPKRESAEREIVPHGANK